VKFFDFLLLFDFYHSCRGCFPQGRSPTIVILKSFVGILLKTGNGNLWVSYVLKPAFVNFVLINIHFQFNKALKESLLHCQHHNNE